MKKYQKLWIAGVMAVSLLGTSFTATASANVVTEQTVKQEVQKNNKYESRLDAIIERGYILIGTPGDYKPFTYLNPTTGQYEGYDIDAMKEFAKSLGVEARFVQTSWSTLMDDLLANKFDIAVGGVTRNTDRQKQAYLSQGYIQFGKAPLIRAEDKDKYKTIEDINKPGVRIGVNPGGTNEKFVREHLKNANVTVVQNNLDIPGLVANGTYDVMITDTLEALIYAKADSRLYAALTDSPFTKSEKGYMIPRGDFIFASYLNLWMDEMKLQGKFDELYNKWIK
ncbi:transporter substrate-binding domain-containing protein [Aneurinibacillus aneurinilyticus]|jgi:cyclohexadienyl dehydratase|uniref:Transporter substrate-binding domain-containing protein n=2 Tax=Aneurinibacillus aneurinilyticus TaxID=1391 RepID=A0A848CZ20_ANEAE|nr:transporter substrate-binding domain-containing protein [Aneurinibacillus aneurinilyticus]ERI09041.1 putative cyclohexadienyl dehydratase [Aneurinibacillus aneurinilyticus ATCC 12856]MCI1693369.1 transporter substrate-binding domain-containing protein [Aneurinibacillus aneurinilyticus]MED0671447.1 transporter substrate-binding domain-containing protein [Aneurinibacillus aneurinilyticus]MED0707549.1 transporter substrate-binding domain-containing protein [Aneurinibacillus aneurinilyticus]MED